MKRIAFLIGLMVLIGCGNEEENKAEQNICSTGICVENIEEMPNGFLGSKNDINKIGINSNGNMVSSNTLLIRFKPDVSKQEIRDIIASIGGKISSYAPDLEIYEIKFEFDSVDLIEDKIRELKNLDDVEITENNFIVQLNNLDIESLTDEDYLKSGVWGMEKIKLAEAYRYTTDNDLVLQPTKVAIFDVSFDIEHPELSGQFLKSYDIGDRDNDVSNKDVDFCFDNSKPDKTGCSHGTFIAGIIAAKNDGEGLNGIAPQAKLIAYKIASSDGNGRGYVMSTIMALLYAKRDGASVINISFELEGMNSWSELMQKTIKDVYDNGVVIVASAGNDQEDASKHYPSAYTEVISVGATTQDDKRAFFSNYSQNDSENILTISAPGNNIVSTVPENINSEGYEITSGTSFSAPFVSGLAALLKSIKPDLAVDEVRRIMIDSADKVTITYPDGSSHTWNRINAFEAVKKLTEEEGLAEEQNIVGKTCAENSECGGNYRCFVGFCTLFCYSPDEADELPIFGENLNPFEICPNNTICLEARSPYSYINNLLSYKNCYQKCFNNNDCWDTKMKCLKKIDGNDGVCVFALSAETIPEQYPCGELLEGYENFQCRDGLACVLYPGAPNMGHCEPQF